MLTSSGQGTLPSTSPVVTSGCHSLGRFTQQLDPYGRPVRVGTGRGIFRKLVQTLCQRLPFSRESSNTVAYKSHHCISLCSVK